MAKSTNKIDIKSIKFDKTIQVILAVSAIFLFGTYGIARHIYKGGKALSARLSSEVSREEAKKAYYVKISGIEGAAKDERRHFSEIKDSSWLVNEITNLANKADIRIDLVQPLKNRKVGGFSIVSVRMTTSASYHKVGYFLALLESAPYYIVIDGMSIELLNEQEPRRGIYQNPSMEQRVPRPLFTKQKDLSADEPVNSVILTISCLFID